MPVRWAVTQHSMRTGAQRQSGVGRRGGMLVLAGLFATVGPSSGACCTTNIAYAVRLTVTDSVAACGGNVSVTYTVDGGPEQSDSCTLQVGAVGEACMCETLFGQEESGSYAIRVTSPDGQRHGATTVDAHKTYCHVEENDVEIDLN